MISKRHLIGGLLASPLSVWAPAHAQTPSFASWLQGLRAEALRSGVDAGTLDAALANVEQIPRVMELARNQPEFRMTFERYMELVVSAERVARGKVLLAENRALIERFAVPVGLPPATVTALWGIESNYGTRLGDFDVVPALTTLVYNNLRAQFFRQQLIAALKILSQGHIGLSDMKGSWAGAMGQCQFIPTSFLAYAVDGDGTAAATSGRASPTYSRPSRTTCTRSAGGRACVGATRWPAMPSRPQANASSSRPAPTARPFALRRTSESSFAGINPISSRSPSVCCRIESRARRAISTRAAR